MPNTEVKPFCADGTWLVTARESSAPPVSNTEISPRRFGGAMFGVMIDCRMFAGIGEERAVTIFILIPS